jgi:hypothetical protein
MGGVPQVSAIGLCENEEIAQATGRKEWSGVRQGAKAKG